LKNYRKTIILRNLQYFSKLNTLKKKERSEQKKARYNKLYSVNLADSGKRLDLGGPFSDFSLLLQ